MPTSHDILAEPTGDVYLSLLAFAADHSACFSLVWRRQLTFGATAAATEIELRPFLVQEVETSEWPGTHLLGHTAVVRTYRVSPGATSALAEAGRLYAWLAPQRPEDLAFYTADGHCWLGTIAHENDAFVVLDSPALSALRAAVPGLRLSE